VNFSGNDIVTFAYSYGATTQIVVGGSGVLSPTGTTFSPASSTSNTTQISVSAGGHVTPSGSAFDVQLILPAANIADLGGASSNLLFQDLDILGGTLTSGSVNLNVIGTITANLR